jgi:hypothetical protein
MRPTSRRDRDSITREKLCFCGQPLHYRDPAIELMVSRMVRDFGERVRVSVGARTWLVPRHYIALHGLKTEDVPRLGFEEVV